MNLSSSLVLGSIVADRCAVPLRSPLLMGSMIAAASFLFNRATRLQIHWLLQCHSKVVLRAGVTPKWRTISEDLEILGRLYLISVIAPRWNCHALLASISQIRIENSLTLELAGFGSQ